MKFSIQSYTMSLGDWGKNPKIEDLCKWTKSIGIDAIDWFTTYGTDVKETKKIMDDYGLVTSCYTFCADLNFNKFKDAEKEIDNFKIGVDIACELGTNTVMIPVSGKEGVDRTLSRQNYVNILNKIIKYANDRNIYVTFENFDQRFAPFITSKDMIEANNLCPDFYVCYDSGNMLIDLENPIDSFLTSKNITKFMHFKDFKYSDTPNRICSDGTFLKPALIGEGIVDYKTLVPLVEKYYNGYINIEYQAEDLSPEVAVVKAINYLINL